MPSIESVIVVLATVAVVISLLVVVEMAFKALWR